MYKKLIIIGITEIAIGAALLGGSIVAYKFISNKFKKPLDDVSEENDKSWEKIIQDMIENGDQSDIEQQLALTNVMSILKELRDQSPQVYNEFVFKFNELIDQKDDCDFMNQLYEFNREGLIYIDVLNKINTDDGVVVV